MLENLLFILLILLGVISLIFSLVYFLFGLIKKNDRILKQSYYSLVVPVFCFGLIFFWYAVMVPFFNNSEMVNSSGIYKSKKNNFKIELKPDGTYTSDTIPSLQIPKNGIWKTGGIDGMFEFYDNNGDLVDYASNGIYPDGTEVLNFISNNTDFIKIE